LEAYLTAAGVDVAAAIESCSLLVFDVDQTMSRFLDGHHHPDPEDFESVIGDPIRQALDAGQSTRVYGEMVDLLWKAGQVDAALDLEALWSDLARELPMSLLCAYSTQSVAAERVEAFRRLCRQHSAVVGPPSFQAWLDLRGGDVTESARTFHAAPDAPRAARHFVAATLRDWGRQALIADAALVVTELATNAVLHAQSDFTVAIYSGHEGVRICVGDNSCADPTPRDAPLLASHGRGLGLVAAVANHWQVRRHRAGKEVWAWLRP
jgi:anti-sigma regulatory factor (Ser/Thr protein kinase)